MSDKLLAEGYRRFRKRAEQDVVAVCLDLNTDGFSYEKWGDTQRCKAGDWLVLNGDDTYTIDADTFADTYENVSPGLYRKVKPVWARATSSAGRVATKEGSTGYDAGDYLVCNNADGSDAYAISKDRFEETYEPIE